MGCSNSVLAGAGVRFIAARSTFPYWLLQRVFVGCFVPVFPGITIAVAVWRAWRRNNRTRPSSRVLQTARRRIPARTRASRIGRSSRWSMSCSDAALLLGHGVSRAIPALRSAITARIHSFNGKTSVARLRPDPAPRRFLKSKQVRLEN